MHPLLVKLLSALLVWAGMAVSVATVVIIYRQGWRDGYATVEPFDVREYYDAIGNDYDKCMTALGDAGIMPGNRCDGLEGQ